MNLSVKVLLGFLLIAFGAGALLSASFSLTGLVPAASPSPVAFSGVQVAFCPSPTCVTLVESALDSAKTRVDVAMYSFTNTELKDALVRAHNRGVKVRMIVEKQQAGSQYSLHDDLEAAGIPVRIDTNPALMHHKFAVVDSEMVITGSMNWTGNGVEENNENVNVIVAPALNTKYEEQFVEVWGDSTPFNN